MEALTVVLVVAGAVALAAWSKKRATISDESRQTAAVMHTLSGEYPAVCSWCRQTALARKMTLLEKVDGDWVLRDVDALVASTAPEQAAGYLQSVFSYDSPSFRRLCGEACARQFLERAVAAPGRVEARFVRCEYCDSEFIRGRSRCPNCGASSAGPS